MSNSKGGNAPFSSLSSGPRSFQSKNLNNTLKPAALPPSVRDAKPSGASNLKGGMAVLVGKKQVTKSIGAAATPVPVNTPSFRSESKAKDPWGGTSTNTSNATVAGNSTTTTTPAASITATLAAASSTNKQESVGTATTTTAAPVAPSRSSWAMRDDSDSDDDDSRPAQIPTTATSTDKNDYPDRDWGRENYHEDDEDHYGRQRSRGNSDLYRYQSKFHRDGQEDRRYRDSNRDNYKARDRYERPAFDKRNSSQQPLQINSRARAMSEDFPSAAEDIRDNKEYPNQRPYVDHQHARNESFHHNNRENRDREPDSRPRYTRYDNNNNFSNTNRPYIQRERASFGSFENSSSRYAANVNNVPGDRSERPTWQRTSAPRINNDGNDGGSSKMNIAPTLLSKEQLKVNQVNTTLLRPKLEVGAVGAVSSSTTVASSGTAGLAAGTTSPPVMKVLSKQHVASAIVENAVETGDELGKEENKSSGSQPQDSFSKTFSSLLAAKERNDAIAAASSGDNAKNYNSANGDYPEDQKISRPSDMNEDRVDHQHYRIRDMDRPRRFRDDNARLESREENDRHLRGGYNSRRDDYHHDHLRDDNHYGKSYGQSRYHNERANGPPAVSGSYRAAGRNNYASDNQHEPPYPPPTRPLPSSSSQVTLTAILPPKRKGERVLYEPKSGQFVEDAGKDKEKSIKDDSDDHFANTRNRKYSDSSSIHNAHGAHTHTTITTHHSTGPASGAGKEERKSSVVEEGGRWARVSVIKRGLEDQQNANIAAINDINSTINKQSDKVGGADVKPEEVLTKEQKKELERLKDLEDRKALREQERLNRKPRTKGQLYRYNAKGEIEKVPAGERVFDVPVTTKPEEANEGTDAATQPTEERKGEETADVIPEINTETAEKVVTVAEKEPVVDSQSVPTAVETTIVNPPPAVANPTESEEVAVSSSKTGNKSPTTPKASSELVATASVFTPSQPLLASLQQQQSQQPQLQQQPGLIPNTAGIMSSPAPSTPATNVASGVPGPPMFLSSPGMTNMLFGNNSSTNNNSMMNNATGMDMFSHHLSPGATYGMNSMAMGNMTGMGVPGLGMTSNNNMYYGGMNMMPTGMMVDSANLMSMVRNNNSNMSNVNGMYGGMGSNVNAMGMGVGMNMGNLGWGSAPVTNSTTSAVAGGMSNTTNPVVTGNEDSSSAATANAGVVKDMFASPPTNTMNNNSMSNWGYNATSGNTASRYNANSGNNNNNLYGMGMMDMDGMNNFYYGGGTNMGMGFFPGGNSMNHATAADAMMFGNMNTMNGQQMYGYGNMGYPQQQPLSQTNNMNNNNHSTMNQGAGNAASASDMFASNTGTAVSGTAGGNNKTSVSATTSPSITGASADVNQPSSLQSSSATTGVSNNLAMNNNGNINNNSMMSQNYNAMGAFNNNNVYNNSANSNNSNVNNNSMYGRGFRNNNANNNNNSNMNGGGMGYGSNMNNVYGNANMYGNMNNGNNSNNSGNMNNINNNNGMMYNAAPGGYTNMRQQQPQQQGGRNYGNNSNNYYNNYNNNYQQR